MDTDKKEERVLQDQDIAYSRSIKAGKRIYYLDVKRTRNDELYLCLTESKKKVSGNPESPDVSYEKHKIFIYQEDLAKFTEALFDVIQFMQPGDETEPDAGANESLLDTDDEPAIRLNLEDFE